MTEKKTEKESLEGKLENVFNVFPNLSDKVLDYNAEKFNIVDLINNTFIDYRKYKSDLKVLVIQ